MVTVNHVATPLVVIDKEITTNLVDQPSLAIQCRTFRASTLKLTSIILWTDLNVGMLWSPVVDK